jgi:hypothetical protein
MTTRGRPTKPTELKRAQGTLRPHRLPSAVMPMYSDTEALLAPPSLLGEGLDFWQAAWSAGWLNPVSDQTLTRIVAEQLEEREQLRERVLAEGNPRDRSGLRELERQLVSGLGQLGFSPAERSRLGLTEVKTETKLEALMRRKAEWQASLEKG